MNAGQTVFAQVIARIPHWEFRRAYSACNLILPRNNALSPWDHFLALCFAQMTFRQSLRDIEACLRAQAGLAYHMGFRWLKHGLRIQTFYGTSETAVRLQLWASVCMYLAMAITRKQLGFNTNLTTFVQVLSLHALSKVPIHELFENNNTRIETALPCEQLIFNNLK